MTVAMAAQLTALRVAKVPGGRRSNDVECGIDPGPLRVIHGARRCPNRGNCLQPLALEFFSSSPSKDPRFVVTRVSGLLSWLLGDARVPQQRDPPPVRSRRQTSPTQQVESPKKPVRR
jgi:hypothetical protein